MVADLSSSRPGRADPLRSGSPDAPLDGEVIPPIRVVNGDPEPAPSATTASVNPPYRVRLSTALLTSALMLSVGVGGTLEARQLLARPAPRGPDATMVALAHLRDDFGTLKAAVDASRQNDGAGALKTSVDVLKADLDTLRSSGAAAMAQLAAKLDKPAPAPNLSEVTARLDRLDHDPKLADIAARLDRIERQVSSVTPTGSVAPRPAPPATSTQPISASAQPKVPVKPVTLDNWIVRDVYSGLALVEGRSGSVREVAPGEVLPGAGEVRSIERRGRSWIVVTSRGIIDNETW